MKDSEAQMTFAVVCLLVLWSVCLWYVTPYLSIEQGLGDRERYLAIATTPFEFTASPWGYRIAVPWTARAMTELSGMPLEYSFEVLQFVFFVSINMLLYHVCRYLGASNCLVALVLLTFATGYQFVYYRFNSSHVGMSELSLLGWLCWWLHRRRYGLVAVGLLASILVKESIAFIFLQVLVLYWFSQWVFDKKTDISFLTLCVISVLPLLLFIAIRLGISAPGESGVSSYLGGYDDTLFNKLFGNHFPMRVVAYFTVFGGLLSVVIYSFKYIVSDPFVRIQIFVFLVAITQLVLALDSKRLASMAVISVLLLTVRLVIAYKVKAWGYILLVLQVFYGFFWLNQFHLIAVLMLAASLVVTIIFAARHFLVTRDKSIPGS